MHDYFAYRMVLTRKARMNIHAGLQPIIVCGAHRDCASPSACLAYPFSHFLIHALHVKRCIHDHLRLIENAAQMRFTAKTLGVDLVNIFGA